MDKVTNGKAKDIFETMNKYFEQGHTFWIVVTGMSMYPLLRHDKDMVELEPITTKEIKKGDILLFERENGEFVLHRVYKNTEEGLIFNGDEQRWVEGPVKPSQVKAKVTGINRNGKKILVGSFGYRVYSRLWTILKPFRYFLIGFLRKVDPTFRDYFKQ